MLFYILNSKQSGISVSPKMKKIISLLLGYVRVILELPNLEHFEHGSMLCDVLDYGFEHNLLKYPSEIKIKVSTKRERERESLNLKLPLLTSFFCLNKEFYSSEEYYFHTEEQVKPFQIWSHIKKYTAILKHLLNL